MDALPDEGGKLTVLPGSVNYQCGAVAGGVGLLFNGGVGFGPRGNVTLELMPGAVLEMKAGVSNLIACTGPNFRLIGGGKLLMGSAADANDASLLLLSSDAGTPCDNCLVRDIEFEMVTTNDRVYGIHSLGAASDDLTTGLTVENCLFRGDEINTNDQISFVKADNVRHVHVRSNSWQQIDGDTESNFQYGVRLRNCPQSEVSGNSFRDSQCTSLISLETIVVIDPAPEVEGGHTVVQGNTMESSASATQLINVACDFVTIIGNNLDRHSDLNAAVLVGLTVAGTSPRCVSIIGNSGHSYSYSAGGSQDSARNFVRLDAVDGCLIASNLFYNFHENGTFVSIGGYPACQRVKYDPNSNHVVPSRVSSLEAYQWARVVADDARAMIPTEAYGSWPPNRIGVEQLPLE
jgi:hypothetical protein